jgi:hypothetical protein
MYDSETLNCVQTIDCTEVALGCRSRLPNARAAVLFQAAEDRNDTVEATLNMTDGFDAINLTNWGYPDGYTAIHLPNFTALQNPFVISRAGVPSVHNTNGIDHVLAYPGPTAIGTVASSPTCNLIELVITYDRVAMCVTPPPLGRVCLRDCNIKRALSDIHALVWLKTPVEAGHFAARRIDPMPAGPFELVQAGDHSSSSSGMNISTENNAPPPPPSPYSQLQAATSVYNLLIAPPGKASVHDIRVADFLQLLADLPISHSTIIVVSHPDSLLTPKEVAAEIQVCRGRWWQQRSPPSVTPPLPIAYDLPTCLRALNTMAPPVSGWDDLRDWIFKLSFEEYATKTTALAPAAQQIVCAMLNKPILLLSDRTLHFIVTIALLMELRS